MPRVLKVLERLRRPKSAKERHELEFWRARRAAEGELGNAHYERAFTVSFGLVRDFYAGKRILDVGCGPRGSLVWADHAARRVGLDPLARAYERELGIDSHPMEYVAAPMEEMPFESGAFDVVSSFNSLDHVDDVDRAAAEIVRVLAPGGTFLLITELNHESRPTEPQDFSFDVIEHFVPPLRTAEERRIAKTSPYVYGSVDNDEPWDAERHGDAEALLVARLEKPV
jgi:ubiquinone/menaquinone biosynthesis C-methylase UbiE